MESPSRVKNISDYLREYNSIIKNIQKEDNGQFKKVKIAVLASSTINGLKEALFVKCYELKIIPEIFIGGYNQYSQEILDSSSQLYDFKPDLVFLFIDTKSLLGDAFFDYYQLSEKERGELFEDNIKQVKLLANTISRNINCKIIVHNFEVPVNSPLGIIDNKQKLGFIEFIKNLNSEITQSFKGDSQIFVFDYDLFCSKWGKNNLIDYKMYYFGDIKIDFKYLPYLCDEYISYIKAVLSLTKKCIVLDLDNVLWGGIIGEDDFDGIKLGPTPEGRPFFEFQKYILSLFNRGVILAINSKNNPEEALNVLRSHPYMILKEKHFASIQINWNDKAFNMEVIAKEINIGLDSLVFFDDDKLNREMIKEVLPEVKVIDLPDDSSLYLKTLMDVNDFNSFYFSEEDKRKGQMYVEQGKRLKFRKNTTDITEYLKALDMIVTIEHANSFNIPRVAQLTQKTNQFNMTTKRYSEEDVKKLSEDKDYLVFSIKVEDKFGDNGIVGAAIIKKNIKEWTLDTFLLSCRIIGRKAENTMLAYILEEARKEKISVLKGDFISTERNGLARDFYKNNMFDFVEKKDGKEVWKFLTRRKYSAPEFIREIRKGLAAV